MPLLRNILSLACGLISAIATFLLCVFGGNLLDSLTSHHFTRFLTNAAFIVGLILGLVVSGVVRNAIYQEPTRF